MKKSRITSRRQSGFTLVEVLVALFIFSILSAASLAVLTTSLKSKDLMQSKSTELRQRATLRILMKSDFANTLAIPKTDAFGQKELASFIGGSLGDERFLSLSRTGWDNPGGIERRSGLQAVEYVLRDKTLIRQVRARFNPVSNTPVLEQPLMNGVERISLGFFNGEIWSDNWLTGLPPTGVVDLPKLASIELEFSNGDKLRQIFRVGADQ